MKAILNILILLIVLIPLLGTAQAGTPIPNDMAQKYFENCVAGAQKEGTMTAESQKRYCACTAMNMQKSMTQEDLKTLNSNDASARLILNKVLIDVNGPCMQYPVHDLLYKECTGKMDNPAICGCLARKMGQFTAAYTSKFLPDILAKNPEIYDPMTPIMESQEFQQQQKNIAFSCATNPNQP